jgi:shikimate kinase
MGIKLPLNKNIILTGFSGVGKSNTSRILAKQLHTYAIDTDELIEFNEHKKIKDIFKEYGEDYFRTCENNVALYIKNNIKNTIIATGGGFPIFVKNIDLLGINIYLYASFDDILKNLSEKELKKRVLFDDLKNAKEIFINRHNIYKGKADFIIDASINFEQNVSKILHKLETILG